MENGLLSFRGDTDSWTPKAIRSGGGGSGTGVKEIRELGRELRGGGFDYQVVATGMAEPRRQALSKGQPKQDFEVQRVDYVGPQVGKQLRNRGVMALLYAMLAILVYVAFRFDFKFGPGALAGHVARRDHGAGYYLVTHRSST